MNYQNSTIGFVCGELPKKAPQAPDPAPVLAPQVQFLQKEVVHGLIYAAMLEKEVVRLQAEADKRPFYLQ